MANPKPIPIPIPGRDKQFFDPSDLSTTPGGTIFGVTPGGSTFLPYSLYYIYFLKLYLSQNIIL